MTHPVLPAPRLDADIQAYLTHLTHERILEPAENAGFALDLFGASVLPQRQTIVRTEHGSWLFVDHAMTPPLGTTTAESQSRRSSSNASPRWRWPGFVPITSGSPTSSPRIGRARLPQLVPAPAHVRRQDELLLDQVREFFHVIGETAAGLGALVSDVGLDPIVLGGVQHPHLPVVSWVVLAQWTWE